MTAEDPNVKSEALAYLRRESLDIYNRVHSIAEDCEFVKAACRAYPDLPVVPNLRCGAWYVDPTIASGEVAYFKSTDGHFNNWTFNLRRPNVHLLPFIVQHGGFDTFWQTNARCAVKNGDEWDVSLFTSPAAVSRQEHAQIETRLDEWARLLTNSSYDLPNLTHSLRPLWVTPSTSLYPHLPPLSDGTFYPVVCISASKQIEEGFERRSNGFSYIQGSGDDHELWGQGLTPDMFWRNRDRILNTDRFSLPGLIGDLVAQRAERYGDGRCTAGPTKIAKVQGTLLVGKLSDLPLPLPHSLTDSADGISYVLISEEPATQAVEPAPRDDLLRLQLPQGKRGQKLFLESVLPRAMPFVDLQLSRGKAVCICCDSGKDASVGIALIVLQLFFDNAGQFLRPEDRGGTAIDKKSISTRLQWIITSRPQANPARATLKRVNEFLMTSPALRGK